MNLLNQHGYVMPDPTGRTAGLVLLTKLTVDGVTANQFLSWKALQRNPHTQQVERFQALPTDLADLNEKLLEYGFPPLQYEIQSDGALKTAIQLVKEFGKKLVRKI